VSVITSDVQVRLLIVGNEVVSSDFYSHELYPVTSERCLTSEWAQNHFADCDVESLREEFSLPKVGDVQVLATIRMVGDGPDYNGEYDEWFEVVESKYEVIPETLAKFFTETLPPSA
jgi:hypothetical protein